MKHRVFIDGDQGTTGLRLARRLAAREDVELLSLPEARRKELPARAALAREADVTFLCLPDDAARELVAALDGEDVCLLDASTAHRTDPRFAYGFPELGKAFAAAIATSNRISVPGCHASGAIALGRPLRQAGLLAADAPLCFTSLTGYTGGGKRMIAEYEAEGRDDCYDAPRAYGVTQTHKHLPEIQRLCELTEPPVFQPIVCDYPCGMLVSLPLWPRRMGCTLEALRALYAGFYAGQPLVSVSPLNAEPMLAANARSGRDSLEILLTGFDERCIAYARFDNLGKGASGAAIECMNLRLGLPLETGLTR